MNAITALLRKRADSYASDARKFRDAGKLGQPIVSAEKDTYWAASYQVIADELLKAAEAVRAEEHYHQSDGMPGHRTAPPCVCDTPNTALRPSTA